MTERANFIVSNAAASLLAALVMSVVGCGEKREPPAASDSSTAATSGGANGSDKPDVARAPSAGAKASNPAAQGGSGGLVAAVSGNAGSVAMAPTAAMGPPASMTMMSAAAGTSAASAGSSAAAGGVAAGMAAAAGSASSNTPWQWPTGKPEDFGVQTAWLEDAASSIQASTGNRYGMVVVRKGTLIYEKYWDGGADDKHIVYSCTKSWGSSLIGIAVTQGLLTVKDEVRKWVPMPAPGVSEGALLEHVLTQSAHTTPPGQSFQYNSGYLLNTAPEVLGAAISSMGMTPHDFFVKNLAEPLGLQMTWPECPPGGCNGTRYKEGFIQFGNEPPEAPNADLPLSSVRDQAKLGWLWANNGKWDDKQLIDPSYIQAGSQPGAGFRGMYGYLMWIQNAEQFGAIGGVGNCYVNIMPSKQLVIAVMGNDTGLGQGGGWSAFQSLANRIAD